MPETMQDVALLSKCARSCRHLEGDVAEAGVYYGASARLLARFFEGTNKTIHLFDVFDKMPPKHEGKDPLGKVFPHYTTIEEAQNVLADFDNIKFYKGLFKDTLKEVADKKFCFVHVDCDLYDGAKDSCEFFYPRMVVGGVMMFHDYGTRNFPGIQLAVEEFFIDKPDLRVTNRFGSHHVMVKR